MGRALSCPLAPSTGLADVKEGEGPLLVPSGLEDELEGLEPDPGRGAEIIPAGWKLALRGPSIGSIAQPDRSSMNEPSRDLSQGLTQGLSSKQSAAITSVKLQ